MNRHNATFAKVALPVLVSVLVVDAVLDVVGEQVLQLQRCSQLELDLGVFTGQSYQLRKESEWIEIPCCEILSVRLDPSLEPKCCFFGISVGTLDGKALPSDKVFPPDRRTPSVAKAL